MTSGRAEEILKQQLEQEYKTESKIISLLNQFGEVIVKKYEPLKFSINDIHVLFKFAKERLRYLMQYCLLNNMENSLKHLTCLAFKALFLNLDDFKLDDLEKKIQIFRVILDCIKGIPNKNQTTFLNELMNNSLNEKLILLFNQLFKRDFSYFVALAILKYQPNLFNEFMIRKILTYSDIKIDFEYSELQKFTVDNLIDDLFHIFRNDNRDNKTSLIHLKIENDHLKAKDFSNEEIIEAFEDFDEDNINPIKISIKNPKTHIKNSIEEKALSKEPKNVIQSQQMSPKENERKKNIAKSQQIESKLTNENACIIQSSKINPKEINENKNIVQHHHINPIDIYKNEIQSKELEQKEIVEKKLEMITESNNEKKNDIQNQEITPKENNKNSKNEEDNIETMEDMITKMKKMEKAFADFELFKKEKELNEIETQNNIEKLQKETKFLKDELAKEKQSFKAQLAREKQSLKDEFAREKQSLKEELSQENKTLKEELAKEKKTNNKKTKALKKENESLKKAMNSMVLNMTNTRNELDKVKSDLELIKLRDGLKAFIDYVYSGLKLTNRINYENKIYAIYDTFDLNFNSDLYDQSLIKKIKSTLFIVYKKLNSGNSLAHNINLDRSIIDQVFETIRTKSNENYLNELISWFKKGNGDQFMKELIMNRKEKRNHYFDLIEIENKMFSNNDIRIELRKKAK